jgi:hypothetical protein
MLAAYLEQAGILPWKHGEFLGAIRKCFLTGIGDALGHENALRKAREKLQNKLRSDKIVDLDVAPDAELTNAKCARSLIMATPRSRLME